MPRRTQTVERKAIAWLSQADAEVAPPVRKQSPQVRDWPATYIRNAHVPALALLLAGLALGALLAENGGAIIPH